MANAVARAAAPELVLGRYRPLRPLGNGTSGSVWLAHDEKTGLDVALKIVAREGKAGARAEREAEAAARLRHAACLRAYAYGRERGHVYIAYEYVPGRTFRDAQRSGDLKDAQVVEACAQLLDGLAHAHERGVVHRDVKPANVLLASDADVAVRLLDFGLAAFADAETLTAVGDVPGTLAYISPERLAGAEGTAAADVWAVGVMLWEGLAGRHPFWRPSLLETGRAIEAGAPPLRSVRPDLPESLLRAVEGALASDARRRPDAATLAADLRAARSRPAPLPKTRLLLGAPRLLAAGAAGALAAFAATALPFWPTGLAPALTALAAAVGFARPRLGLALALACAVFPLGNLSLGLALAYVPTAAVVLALATLGPMAIRRAVVTATTTVAAAGLEPLDVAREESPVAAARTVLAAVPVDALRVAIALAVAAATVSLVRTPWRAGLWSSAAIAALLLPNPHLAAIPVVGVAWVAAAVLALKSGT